MAVMSGMGADLSGSLSGENRTAPYAPGGLTATAPTSGTTAANLRAAAFASGIFAPESTPPDPHYRVQLTEAGDAIIAKTPGLAAKRSALPVSRQRGFTWAAAVSRGNPSAAYLAFLWGPWIAAGGARAPFDPEVKAGFDIGMAAAAPVIVAVVGGVCGAEPARRPSTGLGPALFVDAAAGARYLACVEAEQLKGEKAIYDAIVSRNAGPPDGCGPEPKFNLTSGGAKSYVGTGSPYSGAPLGAAWAACRAAVEKARASDSPPVVPGSPQVVPSGLVSGSSGSSGSGSAVLYPDDFGMGPAPGAQPTPLSTPTTKFLNLGPTEAERAPRATSGIEVAAGIGAVLLAGWFLHSRGVI